MNKLHLSLQTISRFCGLEKYFVTFFFHLNFYVVTSHCINADED